MERIKLRRTSSNYIGAVNNMQYANLDIKSTSRNTHISNNSTNINLYKLYLSERSNCRNYRIIMTIKPYCTNVLFNTCTEIEYIDSNDKVQAVTENNPAKCDGAIGKSSQLVPYDMIRNTEYSSEKYNFEYHPGIDIFNNHIIRNKSYRIVNRVAGTSTSDNFNTIDDYMRLQDGKTVKKCCRLDIDDSTEINKHLYDVDDILEFENGDAINENLKEENGWLGFYNTSTIDAKDKNGDSMDISRVINNKGNCQFIDMYPDRTLFSFSPVYNEHRNRVEYNWDLILTYPYAQTVQRELSDGTMEDIHSIQSNNQNGLFVVDAKMINLPSGGFGVQFRTLTKHNLKKNDTVHLYFNENNNGGDESEWNSIDIDFIVSGLGDEDGNYKDYYFYLNNTDLLDRVFCTPKEGESYTSWDYILDYFYEKITPTDISDLSSDNTYTYKIGELVYHNSILYMCVNERTNPNELYTFNFDKYFTKLSSVCNRYDAVNGLMNFPTSSDAYIMVGNAYYGLFNHDIQKSYYSMAHTMTYDTFIMRLVNNAFRIEDDDYHTINSNGLWNDYISFRVVKVSGNFECKYYVRKFKKLPGNYSKELYKLAFSTTIYGDEISQVTFTDTINTDGLVDNRGRELTDIYLTVIKANRGHKEWYIDKDYDNSIIECSHCFGPLFSGFDYLSTTDDNLDIRDKRKGDYDIRYIINDITNNNIINFNKQEITVADDWFYGDIVEYNPYEYTETSLCDINYRFNTMQRECGSDEYILRYDDIVTDDYSGEFKTETTEVSRVIKNEGYYYKPHHRIRLRGQGELIQDTHRTIFVDRATPYQDNGMYIKLRTSVAHKVLVGHQIIITDNIHNYDWYLNVIKVVDKYNFVINKVDRNSPHYHDWITICTCINNGDFTVKAVNDSIPSYAEKIADGTYVWRENVGLWDDEDAEDLLYANNALYIDSCLNLFVKRQNKDRSIDYNEDYIDILNNPKGQESDVPSNNEYTSESDNRC